MGLLIVIEFLSDGLHLAVPCQAAATAEPGEGALDEPAPGQDLEALGSIIAMQTVRSGPRGFACRNRNGIATSACYTRTRIPGMHAKNLQSKRAKRTFLIPTWVKPPLPPRGFGHSSDRPACFTVVSGHSLEIMLLSYQESLS